MTRRSARAGLLVALWLVAAAGALLLGLTAVGSIGSGLTGGGTSRPLTGQEIDARLAEPEPVSPLAAPAPAGASPVVVPAGEAGTLLVRCDAGRPRVVSVNPAQGFASDGDDDQGTRVSLRSDDTEVEIVLRCEGTRPVGDVVARADD